MRGEEAQHPLIQVLRSIKNRALFHVGRRIRSRHVLAQVRRHAPAGGRVLDAGAGGGAYTMAMARRFSHLEIEGVELDPDKVAACEAERRAEGLANARFEVGDITRIGRPDRYDLIVSVDVLEHVEDDAAAFRSLLEAMRPGGLLLLHVPRANPRRFLRVFEEHHQDDHVREGYEPGQLAEALVAAGFDEVIVDRTFGTSGELAWEVMHLVRRGRPSRLWESIGILVSPLLVLLCELDFWLGGGKEGNGLLVRARRPAVAAS
jgi:2-polyprenyl-3-methyl-5-hydroxy-6-metoxy-1,4-benzoquinol methylase